MPRCIIRPFRNDRVASEGFHLIRWRRQQRGTLQDAWYRGAPWLCVLVPLEWLYRAVIVLRRGLYRVGLLPIYRAPVPVAVVGNLTVGGSGKTPVVIALAEALTERGVRVGVVSRGYGRQSLDASTLWVGRDSEASTVGDEPLLIVRRTGLPCAVAADRGAAIRCLLQREPLDIVIADDGLQHYAMARDLEIVLYDKRRGFGNGRCLPAGPLREPLSRLRHADVVLGRDAVAMPSTARGNRGTGEVAYHALALVNVHTGETRSLDGHGIAGSVYAVAGLSSPDGFFQSVADLGFSIDPRTFPDHHLFVPADFTPLQDKPVIMTEKDAVKCAQISHPDCWYLQLRAQVPESVIASVAALVK